MQPLPYTRLVPSFEASPTRHTGAAAHLLGEHLPGDAAREDEQDAGKSSPIVDAGPATLGLGRFFGQQRLDHFPKFIANEFFRHTLRLPTTGFC